MTQEKRTTLIRNLRVGDEIRFDDGRITVRLEQRTGRSSARVRFEFSSDVVLSKPARPEENKTMQ